MLSRLFMRPKPLGITLVALPQQFNSMTGPGTRLVVANAEGWSGFWRIKASYWAVLFPGLYRVQSVGGGGGGGAVDWHLQHGERGGLATLQDINVLLVSSSDIEVARSGQGATEFNDYLSAPGGTSRIAGTAVWAPGGTAGRNAPWGAGNPPYEYIPEPGYTTMDGFTQVGEGGRGGIYDGGYLDPTPARPGRVVMRLVG